MVLEMESVKSVTVIEFSPDVIKLAGPALPIDMEMLAGEPCTSDVWHDIWTYITEDNVPEITKLKKKYARRCDRQAAWCEAPARMGR